MLRYYLRHEEDKELARGICILFLPFRNELADIHSKDPTELLAEHGQLINENRARFESCNLIQDYIERLEKERKKKMVRMMMMMMKRKRMMRWRPLRPTKGKSTKRSMKGHRLLPHSQKTFIKHPHWI